MTVVHNSVLIAFTILLQSFCLLDYASGATGWWPSSFYYSAKKTNEHQTANSTDFIPVVHKQKGKTPLSYCQSDYGRLKDVQVTPCTEEEHCPLVHGTNVTLRITFESYWPSNTVRGKLMGQFGWLPFIPFGDPEVLLNRLLWLNYRIKIKLVHSKSY